MRYIQNVNYHKRKLFLRRIKITVFIFIVFILVVSAFAYFSLVRDEQSNTTSQTTSIETSNFFAPSFKTFSSPYFEFQTDDTWSEIPAETTDTKFVYRSVRTNLVEHSLIVYVNIIPTSLQSNRVLPVSISLTGNTSSLRPESVSDHCKSMTGQNSIDAIPVSLGKVSILCDADSTDYSVLVGKIDGTSSLRLSRPNGSKANYSIIYTNMLTNPDSSQIVNIISTFQTQ